MPTLIFDLDGTLVHSAPDILRSLRHALERAGVRDIPPLTEAMIGPPLREIVERLPTPLDAATRDAVIAHFRAHYDSSDLALTSLYPEMHEVLERARARGCRLFIATNKPEKATRRLLGKLAPGWFEDVACVDSLPGRALSKSDMIQRLLDAHGLDPSDTWVIGDGVVDIVGAVETGCRPVAVLYGYGREAELIQAGATARVAHPMELDALLTR